MVLLTTAACGMMRDESTTAKQDWFEYAYYSSGVNFEHDADSGSKPIRMKLPTH